MSILEWFGLVFVLFGIILITVFFGIGFFGWLLDRRKKVRDRIFNEGREWERSILDSNSWWFEHKPTHLLLKDLAAGASVSGARDRWRERMNEYTRAEVAVELESLAVIAELFDPGGVDGKRIAEFIRAKKGGRNERR